MQQKSNVIKILFGKSKTVFSKLKYFNDTDDTTEIQKGYDTNFYHTNEHPYLVLKTLP